MNIKIFFKLSKEKLYIVLSFIFWIIAEFITVWHSKDQLNKWISTMPYVFLQYLFIILIFYLFLFKLKWNEKKVFIAMLIVMSVFELLWQNSLLLTTYGAALLISIWGFLTFIPFWIVNKSIHEHKWQTIYYLLWILLAIIMGTLLYFK